MVRLGFRSYRSLAPPHTVVGRPPGRPAPGGPGQPRPRGPLGALPPHPAGRRPDRHARGLTRRLRLAATTWGGSGGRSSTAPGPGRGGSGSSSSPAAASSRCPAAAPSSRRSAGPGAPAAAAPRNALLGNLGSYHREIKTANADAQKFFDEGLALLYGFNHEESFKSFELASKKDDAAPMPH